MNERAVGLVVSAIEYRPGDCGSNCSGERSETRNTRTTQKGNRSISSFPCILCIPWLVNLFICSGERCEPRNTRTTQRRNRSKSSFPCILCIPWLVNLFICSGERCEPRNTRTTQKRNRYNPRFRVFCAFRGWSTFHAVAEEGTNHGIHGPTQKRSRINIFPSVQGRLALPPPSSSVYPCLLAYRSLSLNST